MRRWRAFEALCRNLHAGLLSGQPIAIGPEPWEWQIEFSSRHLVTPALAWSVKDAENIAADVRDYFKAILSLNDAHNEAILDGLARIVGALNAAGIEPMLLKGAAYLVEGLYPAPSIRVVGDIDLLVADGLAANAAAALYGIGFISGGETVPETHHHLPMMHDHAAQLTVEIHTRVEHRQPDQIAPSAWFRENPVPHAFRDLRVLLPDATRAVAHNVIHGQLNHGNHREGRISLRELLDLAMIRASRENKIDWAELDRRFSHAGEGEALATYLAYAEHLFGQPAPPLTAAPRLSALDDLRHAIDPASSWPDHASHEVAAILVRAEIRQDLGNCWVFELSPAMPSGDGPAKSASSTLELFEDSKPLGPKHSSHDLIRRHGRGAFSHWGRHLYFSTSDNSDPRISGRAYMAVMRTARHIKRAD